MSLRSYGKVYLIGAGCGDYDLITLRGKELLEQCETVVYDSLIDSRILEFVPETAEKICVGKRSGQISETQENINRILIEKALEGKTVVRLKGGDPFVFGRGGEEILALKEHHIEYETVPGISSAVAVPELAGIPVTHRELSRSFHVVTAHTAQDTLSENISRYAQLDGTLVFLMGLKHLREISVNLTENGKPSDTPCAVISNGASSNQTVIRGTLENIACKAEEAKLRTPAIIVVGETAEFDFSSTVSRPLDNISVTVTGTRNFVSKMSAQLEKNGASVRKLDNMNVIEYRNNPEFDNALRHIEEYRWLVLTSRNGAEIFFGRLLRLDIDIRKLNGIKIAVIGSGTAEILKKRGIFVDLVPDSYTSKALAQELSKRVYHNERILILRAEQGSQELTDILDENQICYDDIKTYNVLSDNSEFVDKEINTDFITFASSSGVNSFFKNNFRISERTKIICIGDITAKALLRHNINKFTVSETSDVDGITETILTEAGK